MLLLLGKKTRKKRGMRRTYFRSRDCHFLLKGPTRVDMAQIPVAHAQNILPERARDWRDFRSRD